MNISQVFSAKINPKHLKWAGIILALPTWLLVISCFLVDGMTGYPLFLFSGCTSSTFSLLSLVLLLASRKTEKMTIYAWMLLAAIPTPWGLYVLYDGLMRAFGLIF